MEDLKKRFRKRDRAISVLSRDGLFRAVFVRNTGTAIAAQLAHGLSDMAAFFLANTLTATTMLSVFLKGEERVIAHLRGDGLLTDVYAEVLHVGECRGYVKYNSGLLQPPTIERLGDFLGAGTLSVSRILYNYVEPVVGVVPLQKGDIAADFAYYFSSSEQIETALVLDVDFDGDQIIDSGGLMVQAMPGASASAIDEVTAAVAATGGNLCSKLQQQLDLPTLLAELLPFKFDILKSKQVDFFCRCGIEKYKSSLLMLTVEELQDMQASQQNELVCQFCNKKYYLSDADFDAMISQKQAECN